MGKHVIYNRNYDTYRVLVNAGKYDALKDLSDCIDGKAVIAIDDIELLSLEHKARFENRDLGFLIGVFPDIDPWCDLFSKVCDVYKGRNCIVIVSGAYTVEELLDSVSRISQRISDNETTIFFGALQRYNQWNCRVTCIAY